MPPQLEKNHVVPTAWQDEALARDGVSREVPCSAKSRPWVGGQGSEEIRIPPARDRALAHHLGAQVPGDPRWPGASRLEARNHASDSGSPLKPRAFLEGQGGLPGVKREADLDFA